MTERIQKLREASLKAVPSLSLERAMLLTDFYKTPEAKTASVPVARALAFRNLMSLKTLWIGEDELIVGERGPAPKATPTYPEICTHTIDDFHILDTREKIPFKVSKEDSVTQKEEIIPFWRGTSLRDRIFASVDPEWDDLFEAGVFTEFMEQRAPGHTVLDDKIYHKGMLDFLDSIHLSIASIDEENDPDALDKCEELTAMMIAIEGILIFANRHAEKLAKLAALETDPARKAELEKIAMVCSRVPAQAPQTLHEALQYYWFIHLGVIAELNNWDAFNPGRLDRHLYPFWKRDIEEGRETVESARELLQAFWIKFNNQPAPPKVGVTAQESNTYTDFCLINLGGVDEKGEDAVNDLTYELLDVIEEMRILQPSSMVQISSKNPDRFLHRALKIIKTGFGQPSLFNSDAIVKELLRQGKSEEDARNGGASGCVETGAFGKESYILTGYLNLPKILELTLHRGTDPRTGKQIALDTGDPAGWASFEDFYDDFERQLEYVVDVKIRGNRIIEKLWMRHLPAPFLSVLIDDCIAKGVDYNCGGARYNTMYIQGVGLGSITDSLSAIKHHVFEEKECSISELLDALKADFEGHDSLRDTLQEKTPRWGNDDDRVDNLAKQVFDSFFDAVDSRPTVKGGVFRINLLPTTSHVYFGSVCDALPDGRKSGEPLSEGISPVQGMDRNGPTAVLNSAAKLDHIRTGGTLLNQKFHPQVLQKEEDIEKLGHLIRAYFSMDAHHIQFNVVTAETLREAQKNPERYRDLIVRVAGYSDYFVDLTEALQEEIIRRTEQSM